MKTITVTAHLDAAELLQKLMQNKHDLVRFAFTMSDEFCLVTFSGPDQPLAVYELSRSNANYSVYVEETTESEAIDG